jgi:hypothetical protein
MEWLWRGMTYGTLPSMRKEEPMPKIEAPSLASAAAVGDSGPPTAATPNEIPE